MNALKDMSHREPYYPTYLRDRAYNNKAYLARRRPGRSTRALAALKNPRTFDGNHAARLEAKDTLNEYQKQMDEMESHHTFVAASER